MYECKICGTTFTAKSNLSRHKKNVCILKEIQHNNDIKDLEVKYIELDKLYTKVSAENEYLKKSIQDLLLFKMSYMSMLEKSYDTNVYMLEKTYDTNVQMFETNNKIMEINSETTKINAEASIKSLSTAKYISKNLNKAPPLTYEKKEIVGLLEYNNSKRYKPVDYVIYNYTLGKLDEWVGNIIVKVYKKENPFDQSIWVTDNSRFSYYIFDVIENASGKKHEWITDKSGTKVIEKIITPTLNLLCKMLETYLEETKNIHDEYDDMEIEDISRYSNNRQKTLELIKEIKENIIHKDVLKYITPLFSADPIKIEDAIVKVNKEILNEYSTDSEQYIENNITKNKNKEKNIKKK
jgi:hypothetical protein